MFCARRRTSGVGAHEAQPKCSTDTTSHSRLSCFGDWPEPSPASAACAFGDNSTLRLDAGFHCSSSPIRSLSTTSFPRFPYSICSHSITVHSRGLCDPCGSVYILILVERFLTALKTVGAHMSTRDYTC